MDSTRFDQVARWFAQGMPRRTALKRVSGAGVIAITGVTALETARTLLPIRALAQTESGTPIPGESFVVVENLGAGLPSVVTGQELGLVRITIAPKGSFRPDTEEAAMTLHVQSGGLRLFIVEGHAELLRAATGATARSRSTIANLIDLNLGDTLFLDRNMTVVFENLKDAPAVLIAAALATSELTPLPAPRPTPRPTPTPGLCPDGWEMCGLDCYNPETHMCIPYFE